MACPQMAGQLAEISRRPECASGDSRLSGFVSWRIRQQTGPAATAGSRATFHPFSRTVSDGVLSPHATTRVAHHQIHVSR
jgi:hypothetical protein